MKMNITLKVIETCTVYTLCVLHRLFDAQEHLIVVFFPQNN